MRTINLMTLAQECEKNPSIINICKGHRQILCKLLLEQSGYTSQLDKWYGRYCFLIKNMFKVIHKSKYTIPLKNSKKLLEFIKNKKIKIPKDVERFIKNNIHQKGAGEQDFLPIALTSSNVDKVLTNLGDIDNIQHRINELQNTQGNEEKQTKKLQSLYNELDSKKLENANIAEARKILTSGYDNASFFDTKYYDILHHKWNPALWEQANTLIEQEEINPRGSISIKQLKQVLEDISPSLLDAFLASKKTEPTVLPKNQQILGKAKSLFKPKNEDEIFVNKNDIVKILKVYSSGKAYGEVMFSNQKGFFPLTVFLN